MLTHRRWSAEPEPIFVVSALRATINYRKDWRMKSEPHAAMLRDLRQFGDSHLANGEARTADLLFRAVDYIERMEVAHQEAARKDRQRIDRLVALQSERAGA